MDYHIQGELLKVLFPLIMAHGMELLMLSLELWPFLLGIHKVLLHTLLLIVWLFFVIYVEAGCFFFSSLGVGAVEFIICHAEVEIVFVEEKKIGEVWYLLCKLFEYNY